MKICKLIMVVFCFGIIISCSKTPAEPDIVKELAGSGTESDPYLISCLDDLLYLSSNDSLWASDMYFLQTANIEAQDTQSWNDSTGFNPIGIIVLDEIENPFCGNYNGAGYSINNLHINRPFTDGVGLFGMIEESTIQNIILINVNFIGHNFVGSAVGFYAHSILHNNSCSGSVNGIIDVGGLAGVSWYSSATDNNSTVSVTGDLFVGGLIGRNLYSSIENSYCTGNVDGTEEVGGLVGRNKSSSSISSCYSLGDVIGIDTYAGGLVGLNTENSSLTNCYSTGSIVGNISGGLTGMNDNGSTINNSYSVGYVSGLNYVGGLVGFNGNNSFVNNSFWNIETSEQLISDGGIGKTTLEMQNVTTYTSLTTIGLSAPWDFFENPYDDTSNEDYWNIDNLVNDGYPFLTTIQIPIYQ